MTKTYTSSGLHDQLISLRGNPGRIQQHMIRLLEVMNNDEIVIMDATNPAIFCLESAAVMSAATMTDSETKLRRLYPSMANTPEELYLHMADHDYLGIYSNPSVTNITFMFDLEELLQKAVPEVNIAGTKKLTIPRYTKVQVADVSLTLLYPINIQIMPHGGFNVTFDTADLSPIARVDSNLLDWFVEKIDDHRYMHITAPFHQLDIARYNVSLNLMSGFTREYSFDDLYYYTRAYIQSSAGVWTEIKTTMTDMVYNKNEPTVLLKLLNQSIKVTIPQIYLNNRTITDSVRLDIYTTKGPLNINLQNYVPRSYTHDWSPIDNSLTDKFSAPLKTISTMGMYSSGVITGGDKGVTFNELKHMVTSRSTITEGLPINEKQLNRSVRNMGYSIVKNIDNVTDRQYLATRALPPPDSRFIVTNMGLSVSQLETSFFELKELDTVSYSLYRLTIKPQTLYRLDNDILDIVPSAEVDALHALKRTSPSTLVERLNSDNLMYSPYYYVFDIKSTEILPRVYDLDAPEIRSRYFFQDNPSVGISLGVNDYTVANSALMDGWILQVQLSVGSVARALGPDHINVQLSYVGRDEPTRYFIDGYLVTEIDPDTGRPFDDMYIYHFKIETHYDINSEDGLLLTPYRSPIDLTHEFDVITSIRDYTPIGEYVRSDVDSILNPKLFDNYDPASIYMGISQSKVTLKFGTKLDKLWTKTRTVVDVRQLQHYIEDVPDYYQDDVFEVDSNGTVKISYDVENNIVNTNKLHNKGDLIYDDTGEQIFKHKRGETIVDKFGEPIFKENGDGLRRQIDLVLMNAMYSFADTTHVKDYTKHCASLITQWVTKDMSLISNQLLDRSEIFYYPPISMGNVDVNVDDNVPTKVDSRQSIHVKVYMTQINYKNTTLREALSKTITETIQKSLSQKTVSKDAMLEKLRVITAGNVISFEIEGLLNDKYDTVTLNDDTMSLTLGKRVVLLSNSTIDIVDDVNIDYYPHGSMI